MVVSHFCSGEINTAVRWDIPLVGIVLNNRCHGAEKAQQQRHFGARYIGVDLANRFGWKVGDRIPITGTIWQPKQGQTWEFNIVGLYDEIAVA